MIKLNYIIDDELSRELRELGLAVAFEGLHIFEETENIYCGKTIIFIRRDK